MTVVKAEILHFVQNDGKNASGLEMFAVKAEMLRFVSKTEKNARV